MSSVRVQFEGYPLHGGWIRKWFLKTSVTSTQVEQLPWLRAVAMLELDDERHQPVALNRRFIDEATK